MSPDLAFLPSQSVTSSHGGRQLLTTTPRLGKSRTRSTILVILSVKPQPILGPPAAARHCFTASPSFSCSCRLLPSPSDAAAISATTSSISSSYRICCHIKAHLFKDVLCSAIPYLCSVACFKILCSFPSSSPKAPGCKGLHGPCES